MRREVICHQRFKSALYSKLVYWAIELLITLTIFYQFVNILRGPSFQMIMCLYFWSSALKSELGIGRL